MRRQSSTAVVDRLLDPLARSFTPEVAQQIAHLRADPAAAARIAELAGKCNEGTLSDEERAEYEAAVPVSNFIAILQAKARALLKEHAHCLMDSRTAQLVRGRAANRCEYCQVSEDQDPFFTFHIEHIIAQKHGGLDDPSNLDPLQIRVGETEIGRRHLGFEFVA